MPRTTRTLTRRAFTAATLAGAATALPALAHAAPTKGGGKGSERIEELLAEMSIEQKIGQLFVAVGYGSTADQPHVSNTSTTGVDTIADIVRTHHVGGLIYFVWSDNLQSLGQIATLSNDAQAAALESGGISPCGASSRRSCAAACSTAPPWTPPLRHEPSAPVGRMRACRRSPRTPSP